MSEWPIDCFDSQCWSDFFADCCGCCCDCSYGVQAVASTDCGTGGCNIVFTIDGGSETTKENGFVSGFSDTFFDVQAGTHEFCFCYEDRDTDPNEVFTGELSCNTCPVDCGADLAAATCATHACTTTCSTYPLRFNDYNGYFVTDGFANYMNVCVYDTYNNFDDCYTCNPDCYITSYTQYDIYLAGTCGIYGDYTGGAKTFIGVAPTYSAYTCQVCFAGCATFSGSAYGYFSVDFNPSGISVAPIGGGGGSASDCLCLYYIEFNSSGVNSLPSPLTVLPNPGYSSTVPTTYASTDALITSGFCIDLKFSNCDCNYDADITVNSSAITIEYEYDGITSGSANCSGGVITGLNFSDTSGQGACQVACDATTIDPQDPPPGGATCGSIPECTGSGAAGGTCITMRCLHHLGAFNFSPMSVLKNNNVLVNKKEMLIRKMEQDAVSVQDKVVGYQMMDNKKRPVIEKEIKIDPLKKEAAKKARKNPAYFTSAVNKMKAIKNKRPKLL